MKLQALAITALTFSILGCNEPKPPKAGVHVDAPGVKVDVDKKGDKKVDVHVK